MVDGKRDYMSKKQGVAIQLAKLRKEGRAKKNG
jgi:hypothetical protein